MTTAFPTNLDAFTNPAPTDSTTTVSHATQHDNANDSLLALEKVGVGPVWYTTKGNSCKVDGTTDDSAALTALNTTAAAGVIRATQGTCVVGATMTLTTALTVPPGAKFKPSSGVTLTLNGVLDAGPYQIFDTSAGGTIVLGAGACESFRPEWWGADPKGVADSGAAFTAAITAAQAITQGAPRIVCQAGATYKVVSAQFSLLRATVLDLQGAMISYSSTTGTLFTVASASDAGWRPGNICNGSLQGSGGTSIGVQLGSGTQAAHWEALTNLEISSFGTNVEIVSTGGQAFLILLNHCAIKSAVLDNIIMNSVGVENLMLRDCDVFNAGAGHAGINWQANGGTLHIVGGSLDGNGDGTVGQIYVPTTAAITLFMSHVHMEWTSGAVTLPHLDIRSVAANPSYVYLSDCDFYLVTGGAVVKPFIKQIAGELHIVNSSLVAPDLAGPLVTLGDATNATIVATVAHTRLFSVNGGVYFSLDSTGASLSQIGNYQNDLPASLAGTSITTVGRYPAMTIQDTGANGVGVKYIGNGATTPSKIIRVNGGVLQVVNDAGTAVIFQVLDDGSFNFNNPSVAGVFRMSGGAPAAGLGANNDFYFRSDGAAGTRIYHKEAGAWVGIV